MFFFHLLVVFRVSRPAGLPAVAQLVWRRVPEAVFLESIGQEITFVLPYSGASDGTFARLFQDLDLALSDLGLTSYGISDTTLEEVRRAASAGYVPFAAFFPLGSARVRNIRKKIQRFLFLLKLRRRRSKILFC